MNLRPAQERILKENPSKALLNWEMRCIHPDTLIYDPVKKESKKVKDIKNDFHVYSKNEDGLIVIAEAERPIQYGMAPMIEISFFNKERIVVTPLHRFFLGASWVYAYQLISSPSPLPSISEHDPSVLFANVHHCSGTIVNFLLYCHPLFRFCGQLLQWVVNIYQGFLPSLIGALTLSCFSFCKDVLGYIFPHIPLNTSSHLSKTNECSRVDKNDLNEFELHSLLAQQVLSSHVHQKVFLSYFLTNLYCKVLNTFSRQSYAKYTTIREARIVQSQRYYDFHVPLHNNYLCSGVVNHNTGKSLPAAVWSDHPSRDGNAYIITRKANVTDWKEHKTKAKVITKEQFRKEDIVDPTALVIDEAHFFASPLFLKGRSQLATKLYTLVKRYPECHILLLTATPVKNDAWSLHTLFCYMGLYYDWKEWRTMFFEQRPMPYLPRPRWMPVGQVPTAWVPRGNWRELLQPFLEKHSDTEVLGKEDKDDIIVRVKQLVYKKPEDQIVTWTHEHKHEQVGKAEQVLALPYRKAIVAAHYTYQIDELKEALGAVRPVFVMDGRTKDPDAVLKAAQEAEEGYLLVQASMGYGWDGWMFEALVFASMAHPCVHHTQMRGRLRSIEHLAPVDNVYLIGGRWDKKIYDTVKAGHDFQAP